MNAIVKQQAPVFSADGRTVWLAGAVFPSEYSDYATVMEENYRGGKEGSTEVPAVGITTLGGRSFWVQSYGFSGRGFHRCSLEAALGLATKILTVHLAKAGSGS